MRILLSVLLLVCSLAGEAATNWIFALDSTTVQNAMDSAAQGDTLILTNGSATWTTKVQENYKNLFVYGSNGTNTSKWDTSTTITGNISDHTKSVLDFDLDSTNFVRLKGIKFLTQQDNPFGIVQMWGKTCGPGNRTDGYTNGCSFRIDRCFFDFNPSSPSGDSMRAVNVATICGLIDHCHFTTAALGQSQSIMIAYDSNGLSVTNWEAPHYFGTTNTVCIEDCSIYYPNDYNDDGFEAYSSSKFVSRYNTFTNTGIGLHGPDSDARGVRAFEIYMNTFYGDSLAGADRDLQILLLRSGTGVIWSNSVFNTASHAYGSFCTMRVYRANSSYSPYPTAFMHLPTGGLQGPCNGSRSVDGNIDTTTGYPAIDQIGRGSFPLSWTVTTWPYSSNNCEALAPIYMWNNTNTGAYTHGVNSGWGVDNGNDTDNVTNFVKEGRDVIDGTQKPGYTPLIYPHPMVTLMDGTNGGGGSPPANPTATVPSITRRIRIAR